MTRTDAVSTPSNLAAYPAPPQGTVERAKAARLRELYAPNFLVRWAFYGSIFGIPFDQLYIPGTGDRLGVKRVIQLLIIAAIFSRPRVCVRMLPVALLWFVAYCFLRLAWGFWLAPEYSTLWWPSTIELFQFLLPWMWMVFNILRYPKFAHRGLWALVAAAALTASLHIAGIGSVDVDKGIEGRSTVFGQNANEIAAIYGVSIVALVALGLFRSTRESQRLLVFPLAGLIGIALAKTGSRSGVLLAVLGILVLMPQTRAFMPRIKRYVTMLLVAGVLAGIMYQIPTVMKRLSGGEGTVAQREARARMIPVQWDIFLRHPVHGSGPDRYQYELTRRALPYLAEKQQTICSHNLVLLLLDETGIIGFALFATGVWKSLISAWRARLGACGFLPLAWMLPQVLCGLTVSSPIFEPAFWLAIAYSLAGALPLPATPAETAS